MMKVKTSMKDIANNWKHVYSCGYCDLQDIFRHEPPMYYNCGIYGWNCDIYVDFGKDIAITTGYRNMRGKTIPSELIKKYSDIAKAITKHQWEKPFAEIKAELEENRENFLNELLKI